MLINRYVALQHNLNIQSHVMSCRHRRFAMVGCMHEWMSVFHCCLSLAVSISFLSLSPVHFMMLSIHAVFGLPFLLSPPTSPVIRLFSILSLCCRMMCPKYRSFLIFTCDISSCLVPAMEYTCSLVISFVHEILSIFRKHLFSNACIRLSSSFFSVHASQPYVATGHTNAFINLVFVLLLTALFFHIFVSLIMLAILYAIYHIL